VCLMLSSSIADEGFNEMGIKDKARYEKKLAILAAHDDLNNANGLWGLIKNNSIDDWAKMDGLKGIRKYGNGKHRIYISGRYTDCRYKACFVLAHKRKEDDNPESARYRNRVLAGLRDANERLLPVPVDDGEEL